MAVSRQKASGKLGKKTSGSARTTVRPAASVADKTKSAAKPASPKATAPVTSTVPISKTIASPKRVVMTSSEIEAAAKNTDAGLRDGAKNLDAKAQESSGANAVGTPPVAATAEIAKPKMDDPKATEAIKVSPSVSALAGKTEPLPAIEKAEPSEAKKAPLAETKDVSRVMAKGGVSPARAQKKPASAKSSPKKSVPSAASPAATPKPDAKSGAAQSAAVNATAVAKSPAPASSPKTEKASTVSTKSKTAAMPKTAAPTAPKTTPATKKVADVSATPSAKPAKAAAKSAAKPAVKVAAKPAAKPATKAAAPKVVKSVDQSPAASPAPSPSPAAVPTVVTKADTKTSDSKPADMFGFGTMMFMDPTAMESYLQIWKTPEIDAMVTASSDAIEESVEVANEALTKLFETMTGQSDVFSGAGSRVAAQCEELLDTQQKSFEEVWRTSMTLFEKTGGIGTELATWMQREIEATQADMDALTKVESLSEIQELQTKMLNRCYESSIAEGEKVQEIMMSVIADSFDALSKATNAAVK